MLRTEQTKNQNRLTVLIRDKKLNAILS